MKIYGRELRQVALRALESGQARRDVALTLGLSIPTLDRWRREYRANGQDAARPRGHTRLLIAESDLPRLKTLIQAHPDATLSQHLDSWHALTGVMLSRSSLRRALKRLGWSFKKRVFEPVNEIRSPARCGVNR